MIILISLLALNLWHPLPATAYVFSSTYQPQLYITLDGKPAGLDIVIRAHQNDNTTDADDIFLCNDGRCYFSDNHHASELNWHYYIERLNKDIPVDSKDKPKALAEFYQTSTTVEYNQEITESIQSFDFTAREQKQDFTINIDTASNTAQATTIYQGVYRPGEDGLDIGQFNISPDAIRIGIYVLILGMVYFSFKFFPLGHH